MLHGNRQIGADIDGIIYDIGHLVLQLESIFEFSCAPWLCNGATHLEASFVIKNKGCAWSFQNG